MPITINMTKAVEIKKDMIRAERAPLLASLDIEMMRAIEAGDTAKQAEVSAKKQALRDATQDSAILNAQTPEQLKAATPAALQ
jgi:hypothetical protein